MIERKRLRRKRGPRRQDTAVERRVASTLRKGCAPQGAEFGATRRSIPSFDVRAGNTGEPGARQRIRAAAL